MQLEKSKSYLIKRSNSFRDLKKNNSKKKRYFEITIRKDKMDPPSSGLKNKDIIYVAQNHSDCKRRGKYVESHKIRPYIWHFF